MAFPLVNVADNKSAQGQATIIGVINASAARSISPCIIQNIDAIADNTNTIKAKYLPKVCTKSFRSSSL